MAFVNGQPWRIQPWNTEQDDDTLGPWTEEILNLPNNFSPDDLLPGYTDIFDAVLEFVTAGRAYLYFSKTGDVLSAAIDADGVAGAWSFSDDFPKRPGMRAILLDSGGVYFVSHDSLHFHQIAENGQIGVGRSWACDSFPGYSRIMTQNMRENGFVFQGYGTQHEAFFITTEYIGLFGGIRELDYRGMGLPRTGRYVGWKRDGDEAVSDWMLFDEYDPVTEYCFEKYSIYSEGAITHASLDTTGETWFVSGRNGDDKKHNYVIFSNFYNEYGGRYLTTELFYSATNDEPSLEQWATGYESRDEYIPEGPEKYFVIPERPPDNALHFLGKRSITTATKAYVIGYFPYQNGAGYIKDRTGGLAVATIADDGTVGKFTTYWGPDYLAIDDARNVAINVFVTSSRLYQVDLRQGRAWWAPFKGGKNDYMKSTREDVGGDSDNEPGFHIAPEISGEGEAVEAGTFRGQVRLFAPEISGDGESVAAGTFRGRVRLFAPEISGEAELVKAGTFRGKVRFEPGVSGTAEDVAVGTFRGRVGLSPKIAASGETAAAGTAAAHTAIAPEIAAMGESAAAGTIRAWYDVKPGIAGKAETAAAGTLAGRVALEPSVGGKAETAKAGAVAARYGLKPDIRARGETVSAGTLAARLAPGPVIAGQGEAVSAGTAAGRLDVRPLVGGAAETAARGTLTARYDLGPTIAGQGEAVSAGTPASGRYDLRPVVQGSGETATAGTVAWHYDLRPEIAARGEIAAAGMTGGRYELKPEVAASGESVSAGALAADYEIAPEIGAVGESAASGKSAGNYNLFRPSVRATGEQAAKNSTRALFAVRPTIRAKGETVAKGTVAGHCRINPKIFGRARKTGGMCHANGRYVLPGPFRIRGTCEQWAGGDWVLRFRRPEVL